MNVSIKSMKPGAVTKEKMQQGFQVDTLRPAFVGVVGKKQKGKESWINSFTNRIYFAICPSLLFCFRAGVSGLCKKVQQILWPPKI